MVGVGVLTLDLGLDIVDGVGRLHLKGDSLTRDCARVLVHLLDGDIWHRFQLTGLDEDLHGSWATCRPWADSCRCLVGRKVMKSKPRDCQSGRLGKTRILPGRGGRLANQERSRLWQFKRFFSNG
jgi:hypothetical protein